MDGWIAANGREDACWYRTVGVVRRGAAAASSEQKGMQ